MTGAFGDFAFGVSAFGGGFPDPHYDLIAAFDAMAPGVVLQRSTLDALAQAYERGGFVPLTQTQVVAIAGPLPAYPASLPRADSASFGRRADSASFGPRADSASFGPRADSASFGRRLPVL